MLVNENIFLGCEDVFFILYIILFVWFVVGGVEFVDFKDRWEGSCFFCSKFIWVLDLINFLDFIVLFC